MTRASLPCSPTSKLAYPAPPVENTIADLWVLMDVVAEGLIKKSLKDLIADYSGSLEGHRTHLKSLQLHEELLDCADGLPPPILRRMKDEVFKEAGPDGKPMPKKKVYPAKAHSETMPAEQADLYNHQANLASAGKIPKIQALGAFRRISLSPREGWEWLENPADFASASGRLSSASKILEMRAPGREASVCGGILLRVELGVEARSGIEPLYTDLQSAASPLCHRAKKNLRFRLLWK